MTESVERFDTSIGEIVWDHGSTAPETATHMYDVMDLQRACQLYLWTLAIVGQAQWRSAYRENFPEFGENSFVLSQSYEGRLGLLTVNQSSEYFFGWTNLKDRAAILEIPAGVVVGLVIDFWQRGLTDVGWFGPNTGTGGTYVICGPETPRDATPDIKGATVLKTFNERRGILTANQTTDYSFGFSDTRDAATMLVIPDGLVVGMIVDMWQQSPSDIGIFGPSAGLGGTHVIVGPNTPPSSVPEPADGQLVHHIATDRMFVVMRAIGSDDEVGDLVARIQLYHHGAEPSLTIIDGGDQFTAQYRPRGLAFWEMLHRGIDDEIVAERDRLFM